MSVETRVLEPSPGERTRLAHFDHIIERLRGTVRPLDVWVAGDIRQIPSEEEVDGAIAWITDTAGFVRAGGEAPGSAAQRSISSSSRSTARRATRCEFLLERKIWHGASFRSCMTRQRR